MQKQNPHRSRKILPLVSFTTELRNPCVRFLSMATLTGARGSALNSYFVLARRQPAPYSGCLKPSLRWQRWEEATAGPSRLGHQARPLILSPFRLLPSCVGNKIRTKLKGRVPKSKDELNPPESLSGGFQSPESELPSLMKKIKTKSVPCKQHMKAQALCCDFLLRATKTVL